MSVRRLLEQATVTLAAAEVPSPRHDAETLLSHVTGVPRSLLTVSARPDDQAWDAFRELVEARARRVPLQHLTGSTGFRYVDIEVGPGVFIPRPETELLAGWVIDSIEQNPEPVVVELCAGAGAISLSIVHEVPRALVHAVELDESAYGWARRNLDGTGVDLRLGDMAHAFEELDGSVDIVVVNPPYIPLEAWESVAPEARDHDPGLALWSGDDGLDAIRVVESVAWRLLKPGGAVGVEHADAQRESAPGVFLERWALVRDNEDLAGKPRYLTAVKPR